MTEHALSTLPREAKGRVAPPPVLDDAIQAVADRIAAWPGVEATTHWHLADKNRVDGVDFYVGKDELGHIHLEGSIHLASDPTLGAELVADGLGRPFPYIRGWTLASMAELGIEGSVALFRRNYDRISDR